MLQQTDTMLRNTILLNTMPSPDGPLPDGEMIVATLSYPQPNTTVCTVTGQVDPVTAPLLADTLTEAVHDRSHLVVDLAAAASLDSAGLQALAETLDRYEIDGHLAVVVDPHCEASTRPGITGLARLLDLHRELSGALRACAHAPISTAGRHRAKAAD